MALIECPECENEISDTLDECPECGYSMSDSIFWTNEAFSVQIILENYIKDEYPEILREFNEQVMNKINSKKLYDRTDASNNIEQFIPLIKKIVSSENLQKISDNKDYDKRIKKVLNKTNTNTDAYPIILFYIIKKNQLSQEAIVNYEKLSHEHWMIKYKDVIGNISDEQFLDLDFPEPPEKLRKGIIKEINSLNKQLYNGNLFYILYKVFEVVKPSEDENFGVLELCKFIEKNYHLKKNIYDIVPFLDFKLQCGNTNFKRNNVFAPRIRVDQDEVEEDEDNVIWYETYYYKLRDDINPKFDQLNIDVVEDNIGKAMDECIGEALKELKSNRLNLYHGTYEDYKKARDLYLAEYKKNKTTSKENSHSNVRPIQSNVVETNVPSYNSKTGIRCPNCGGYMVQKISTIGRMFSVGMFGFSSSKIGKTMECKSCGYKW